ncbi:MAG TPA: response regulator [bacterium]
MDKIRQETVLLVEDEPVFRLIYRGVLTHAGYRVLEAADGEAGLDLVRKEKPDLVLLDLILPKLSGHQVLQAMRSDLTTRYIPVIVFSVLGQEKDLAKSMELGAYEHRLKGLDSPQKILTLIQTILKSKKPSKT